MHAFTHSASQIPGLFLFLLRTRLGMREMQQNMGVCPPGEKNIWHTWIPLILSEDKKARSFAEKDAMEEKSYIIDWANKIPNFPLPSSQKNPFSKRQRYFLSSFFSTLTLFFCAKAKYDGVGAKIEWEEESLPLTTENTCEAPLSSSFKRGVACGAEFAVQRRGDNF